MSKQTIKILLIGILAGFASGLLGIGGGIVLIPLLTYHLKIEQRTAQGTTLLAIIPAAAFASIQYYNSGNINIDYVVWVATGSMIGIYIGSTLAHKTKPQLLNRLFGVIMVATAVRMFISGFINAVPS